MHYVSKRAVPGTVFLVVPSQNVFQGFQPDILKERRQRKNKRKRGRRTKQGKTGRKMKDITNPRVSWRRRDRI
jgi:hypothetical protein